MIYSVMCYRMLQDALYFYRIPSEGILRVLEEAKWWKKIAGGWERMWNTFPSLEPFKIPPRTRRKNKLIVSSIFVTL